MTKLSKGYYHCHKCDALFIATPQDSSQLRCSVCGKLARTGSFTSVKSATVGHRTLSPRSSVQHHGVDRDSLDIFEATKANLDSPPSERGERVKISKRKEVKRKTGWAIVLVWLVLMVAVVFFMKNLSSDESSDSAREGQGGDPESLVAARKESEKKRVLKDALPACQETMIAFQSATSASGKSQFVYQGVKLSGVMDRYYRDEFGSTSKDRLGNIIRAELLDGFSLPTIGATCKNQRLEQWEVVFVFDENQWKIDW